MSQLIAMIVRIDDLNKPKELSELWHQPLPMLRTDQPEAWGRLAKQALFGPCLESRDELAPA